MGFKKVRTKLITVDPNDIDENIVLPAARAARNGELIVFPTDTVYGVGSNSLLPESVLDIFSAKERSIGKPLILLIADPKDVKRYAVNVDNIATRLINLYWPGPLTLIFKKADVVPAEVAAGGDTVGIRCPNDPVARILIRKAGVAFATTSANIAGNPSPKTAAEAGENLWGRVSYIVDGGKARLGVESTVVDVSWGEPAVVREGALPWEEIIASLES